MTIDPEEVAKQLWDRARDGGLYDETDFVHLVMPAIKNARLEASRDVLSTTYNGWHDGAGIPLGEIIERLERVKNKDAVVPIGWGSPDSYRGFYADVAFEPAENVTVQSMLDNAKAAHGATFTGYKGGDYYMDKETMCWVAPWGKTSNDIITPMLLGAICALADQEGDANE